MSSDIPQWALEGAMRITGIMSAHHPTNLRAARALIQAEAKRR